jgi:hypothetical protein
VARAHEPIDWLKPSPLWRLAEGDFRQVDFFRPTLLEFASDDFMPEFFAAARASRPDALSDTILRPTESGVFKLFQPIHGRFYLVCASLCCRIPGFPDRIVDSGAGESVFFVIRRLLSGQEFAWVGEEGQRAWQATNGQPRRALEGEQRLPLAKTTAGNDRPLHFGYVPVASGETYKVPAAQLPLDPDESPPDLRIEELGSRFTEPLTGPPDPVTQQPDPSRSAIQQTRDDLARTLSVYVLLEGWEYFFEHLPDVARVLRGDAGAALSAPKQAQKQALLNFLGAVQISAGLNLRQALGAVAQRRETLDQPGGVEGDAALAALGFGPQYNFKQNPIGIVAVLSLFDFVRAALPEDELPPIALPKLPQRDDAEYVVRLIYERGQCDPPYQYVSLPSEVFRLASFFDPEAPARTIRMALPGDVSIAGLRKFKKGVSLMMSEAMMRKAESLRGKERDLIKEETELTEPGGLAFICSFSIQIIFIVAFFLFFMFAIILNIAFWWMAFIRICFPIPKSLAPK